MDHVVRYQDGILFLKTKDRSWQDYVDIGKGRAYGVEVMAKKTAGALTGWVSYSWSKSERRFDHV